MIVLEASLFWWGNGPTVAGGRGSLALSYEPVNQAMFLKKSLHSSSVVGIVPVAADIHAKYMKVIGLAG